MDLRKGGIHSNVPVSTREGPLETTRDRYLDKQVSYQPIKGMCQSR